jgi:hypothetical protein
MNNQVAGNDFSNYYGATLFGETGIWKGRRALS